MNETSQQNQPLHAIKQIIANEDVDLTLRELGSLYARSVLRPPLAIWAGIEAEDSPDEWGEIVWKRPPRVNSDPSGSREFPTGQRDEESDFGKKQPVKRYSMTDFLDWVQFVHDRKGMSFSPPLHGITGVYSLKTLLEEAGQPGARGFRRKQHAAIQLALITALSLEAANAESLQQALDLEREANRVGGFLGGPFRLIEEEAGDHRVASAFARVFDLLGHLDTLEKTVLFAWAEGQIPGNSNPSTPGAITKLVEEIAAVPPVLSPTVESVLDPAAGSGSMLLAATAALVESPNSRPVELLGFELNEEIASLAVANWLVRTHGPASAREMRQFEMVCGDAFHELNARPGNGATTKFDVVVCDPPQGKFQDRSPSDWLHLAATSMTPYGHGAVVLPTALLEATGVISVSDMVRMLVNQGKVEGIVLLPPELRRPSEKTASAVWLLRGKAVAGSTGEILMIDASDPTGFTTDRRSPDRPTGSNAAWTGQAAAALAAFRSGDFGAVPQDGIKCAVVKPVDVIREAGGVDLNPLNYVDEVRSHDELSGALATLASADVTVREALDGAAKTGPAPAQPNWEAIAKSERRSLIEFRGGLEVIPARRVFMEVETDSQQRHVEVVTGSNLLGLDAEQIAVPISELGPSGLTSPGDVLVALGRDGTLVAKLDAEGGKLLARAAGKAPSMVFVPKAAFTVRLSALRQSSTDTAWHLTPAIVEFFLNSDENAKRLAVKGLPVSESISRLRLPVLTQADAQALDTYLGWLNRANHRAQVIEDRVNDVRKSVEILSSAQGNQ